MDGNLSIHQSSPRTPQFSSSERPKGDSDLPTTSEEKEKHTPKDLEKLVKAGEAKLSELKAVRRKTEARMWGPPALAATLMTGVGAGLGTALAALIQVVSKKTGVEKDAPDFVDQTDPSLDLDQNSSVQDILANMPGETQEEVAQTLKNALETILPEERQEFLDDFRQQYEAMARQCFGEDWESMIQQRAGDPAFLGQIAQGAEERAGRDVIFDERVITALKNAEGAQEQDESMLAQGAQLGAIAGAAAGVGLILGMTRKRVRAMREMNPIFDLQAKRKAGSLTAEQSEALKRREAKASAPSTGLLARLSKATYHQAAEIKWKQQKNIDQAKANVQKLRKDLNAAQKPESRDPTLPNPPSTP